MKRPDPSQLNLPRSRMSAGLPARLAAEYEAGASLAALAARYPHSKQIIRETLEGEGVRILSYAGQRRARIVRHGAAIADAYRAGASIEALAVRFQMRPRLVRESLRAQGISLRPGRRPAGAPLAALPQNQRRDWKVATLDIGDLLRAGVIRPGRIRGHSQQGWVEATLLGNGAIRVAGGATYSLGGAARALTGSYKPGYVFWRVWMHRRWLTLDTLRREHLARLAAAEISGRLAGGEHGSPCVAHGCGFGPGAVTIRWRARGGTLYSWKACAAHRGGILAALPGIGGRVLSADALAS